jgi:hypothetical protein
MLANSMGVVHSNTPMEISMRVIRSMAKSRAVALKNTSMETWKMEG